MHIAHPNRKEERRSEKKPAKEDTTVVSTHVSQLRNRRQVLLMTCRVKIIGPDRSTTQARALLDSASSISFVTDRLVQRLCLVHRNHSIKLAVLVRCQISHLHAEQPISASLVQMVRER